MGVVTIQNRFTFRTPPDVNLMTINPPNYWIDGIQHMTGVIETDNLRRDFTFNLKELWEELLKQNQIQKIIDCFNIITTHNLDELQKCIDSEKTKYNDKLRALNSIKNENRILTNNLEIEREKYKILQQQLHANDDMFKKIKTQFRTYR